MNSDGGPAFPVPPSLTHYFPQGMSLRDWFAGMALMGEMASSSTLEACQAIADGAARNGRTVDGHIAANAYDLADAMIAEGSKRRATT